MKIQSVAAYTVRIPLPRPVALGGMVIGEREYVLVRVEAREGPCGVGFGFTRGGPVAEVVARILAPLLVGADALLTSALWDRMVAATRLNGRAGLMMRAVSAVDIALWDLKAQVAGLPLYQLLGGHADAVPAIASGGYLRQGEGPDETIREMERYAGDGFTLVKVMVGALAPHEDAERVIRVHQALGPGVRIAVDANGVWRDWREAMAFIGALGDTPLAFVEEPFAPENTLALERFSRVSPVPVAVGETESGRWPFRDLLAGGRADILRHDATLVGGVTEWMRVAAMASAWDIPVLPHWFPEVHGHLLAAIPNAMAVEWIAPDAQVMRLEAIVRAGGVPRAGRLTLGPAPGLGVEVDWKAVERLGVRSDPA